jgi:hypothetical protein
MQRSIDQPNSSFAHKARRQTTHVPNHQVIGQLERIVSAEASLGNDLCPGWFRFPGASESYHKEQA